MTNKVLKIGITGGMAGALVIGGILLSVFAGMPPLSLPGGLVVRDWHMVLLVTGLLVFSEQMFGLVQNYLPVDRSFPRGAELIFWSGLALVVLAPLIAIWRNISALSLLFAVLFGSR